MYHHRRGKKRIEINYGRVGRLLVLRYRPVVADTTLSEGGALAGASNSYR